MVETDVLYLVLAGMLGQRDSEGTLNPVSFYLKKYSPAEANYRIYDKKFIPIV